MATLWKNWQRWRRYLRRHVDITGLSFLLVAVITIAIFSLTRDPLTVCLLLLLPITLLATFGGWTAGLLCGIVAALLTNPFLAPGRPLLSSPLDPVLWWALSGCYLLLGVLVGVQGAMLRQQRRVIVEEIEEKLQHARASAERYEAMLEEMSEGQEFLTRINEELAILNTIATAVNSSLDVRQVQLSAMTHIGTLLNVDEVQIYWVSEEGDSFVLQAASPAVNEQAVGTLEVSFDAGLLGQLVNGRHAMTISEVTHDMDARPPLISDAVKSLIAIPLRTRARLFGALVLGRRSGRSFSEDDERFLGSVGRVLALAIENAKLFKQTQELTLADELTGLANRRMFNLHLSAEINHARVTGARLCLIFFDLDHFKTVNDRYGHLVGDDVLRWLAQIMQQDIRGSDLLCRYGGEEFALIAPDLMLSDAAAVARRISQHIAGTPFVGEDGLAIHLTVSAGVASLGDGILTPESLVTAADRALYAAKEAGRNCVQVAVPEPSLVEANA